MGRNKKMNIFLACLLMILVSACATQKKSKKAAQRELASAGLAVGVRGSTAQASQSVRAKAEQSVRYMDEEDGDNVPKKSDDPSGNDIHGKWSQRLKRWGAQNFFPDSEMGLYIKASAERSVPKKNIENWINLNVPYGPWLDRLKSWAQKNFHSDSNVWVYFSQLESATKDDALNKFDELLAAEENMSKWTEDNVKPNSALRNTIKGLGNFYPKDLMKVFEDIIPQEVSFDRWMDENLTSASPIRDKIDEENARGEAIYNIFIGSLPSDKVYTYSTIGGNYVKNCPSKIYPKRKVFGDGRKPICLADGNTYEVDDEGYFIKNGNRVKSWTSKFLGDVYISNIMKIFPVRPDDAPLEDTKILVWFTLDFFAKFDPTSLPVLALNIVGKPFEWVGKKMGLVDQKTSGLATAAVNKITSSHYWPKGYLNSSLDHREGIYIFDPTVLINKWDRLQWDFWEKNVLSIRDVTLHEGRVFIIPEIQRGDQRDQFKAVITPFIWYQFQPYQDLPLVEDVVPIAFEKFSMDINERYVEPLSFSKRDGSLYILARGIISKRKGVGKGVGNQITKWSRREESRFVLQEYRYEGVNRELYLTNQELNVFEKRDWKIGNNTMSLKTYCENYQKRGFAKKFKLERLKNGKRPVTIGKKVYSLKGNQLYRSGKSWEDNNNVKKIFPYQAFATGPQYLIAWFDHPGGDTSKMGLFKSAYVTVKNLFEGIGLYLYREKGLNKWDKVEFNLLSNYSFGMGGFDHFYNVKDITVYRGRILVIPTYTKEGEKIISTTDEDESTNPYYLFSRKSMYFSAGAFWPHRINFKPTAFIHDGDNLYFLSDDDHVVTENSYDQLTGEWESSVEHVTRSTIWHLPAVGVEPYYLYTRAIVDYKGHKPTDLLPFDPSLCASLNYSLN